MICIFDRKLPEEILRDLRASGFSLLPTKKIKGLKTSLSTHPDIQVCKISENKVVVEPSVYSYYKENLENYGIYGIIVEKGGSILENSYPRDSFYNLAANKTLAIHNFSITDEVVEDQVEKEGLKKINVNQGYGKCNVLFTKTGILTSDMGIYKALEGVKKLLIRPGNIVLKDFSYGFIGGTSGFFRDKVFFLGDVASHPDFEEIKKFLWADQTDFEILGPGPLTDYGSLIFLEGGING